MNQLNINYEVVDTGSSSSSSPSHLVIWLHGLGADGFDFIPVAEQLNLPSSSIRFLFPHAPISPVTINGGQPMRSWYDITSMDFQEANRSNPADIARSSNAITTLIDEQIELGIQSDHIVLAGFSQGGVIALHTALRYPQKLAGIMTLSTYFPSADECLNEISTANSNTPIFSAHGTYDDVVPFPLATIYRQKLAHFPITNKDYPMAHSVCQEEIADISDWLRDILI
jgi:phospholipase/carboxylesterase